MQSPLEVSGLSKIYNIKEAVKNVSFKVNRNEIIGLLGPNGCGKTTTIAMILGLLKPTTGKVKINGIDIWKLTSRQVACSIATVLQENFSDFSLTVREIVTLGRTPYSKWLSNSNSKNDKKINIYYFSSFICWKPKCRN